MLLRIVLRLIICGRKGVLPSQPNCRIGVLGIEPPLFLSQSILGSGGDRSLLSLPHHPTVSVALLMGLLQRETY